MNFQHDDDSNIFLGTYKGQDLYLSGKDVVARFGDKPQQYSAIPMDLALTRPKGHVLREAADRALNL